MKNNKETTNTQNEEETINVTPPTPLSLDEFNNHISVMALDNMSNEEAIKVTGISKEDENFIEKLNADENALAAVYNYAESFLASYMNKIDDLALDGKINKSYTMLLEMANFDEGNYLYISQTGASPLDLLESRFSNIENVSKQLEFLEKTNIANSGQEIKNPSMFCKQLIEYEDNLDDEQKAKLYIICAQTYKSRMTTPYGTIIEPFSLDYKSYLTKSIDLSSNFEIISDCYSEFKFLDSKKNNIDKNVKDAYRRVIAKAKKQNDNKTLYNANIKMAEIYTEASKAIGFKNENSNQYKSGQKAINHYKEAIKAYKKTNNKYNSRDLKALANLQRDYGNNEDWIKTKFVLANTLVGEDKYNVLINIIPNMSSNRLEHINMLSKKIPSAKIPQKKKIDLLNQLENVVNHKIKENDVKEIANIHISEAKQKMTIGNFASKTKIPNKDR